MPDEYDSQNKEENQRLVFFLLEIKKCVMQTVIDL